jgi:hypothetical protein
LPAWAAHATTVVVVISGDDLDRSRGYVVGVRDGVWGVGGLSCAAAARTARVDDSGRHGSTTVVMAGQSV